MNGNETINDFCYPLFSMDQVFILIYLNNESNWSFQSEFITETFNLIFSTQFELKILKMAILKFSRFVNIKEKIELMKEKLKLQHEVIKLPIEGCFYCKNKLQCSVQEICLGFQHER
jgi:hypothetical protein